MTTHRQTGTTLIELMISLVLSLVLIGGISSLFLQIQKINRSQRAINNMVEDGRYAQEVLKKEIRRTGGLRSKLDSTGGASTVFTDQSAITIPGTSISLDLNNNEFIKGDSSTPVPANDAFVIRYQLIDSDNSRSPCTVNSILNAGEDPEVSTHVTSIYFFVSSGSLLCTSQRSVNGVCGAGVGKNCTLSEPPATLIDNVQNLTVRYGVDTDNDKSANYYVDAATVEAGNLWQGVISMRLSLVLKSEDTHLAQQVRSYTVEETAITPGDNSLYRVFSTTIALRNQL